MKKLTLVTLISTALSAGAFAGDHKDKIDTTFADLDNDDNGYISREEADDDDIYAHFSQIDLNEDMRLSIKEFNTHVTNNPEHFEGDVVASVQSMKNNVEEVDPLGLDDVVFPDLVVHPLQGCGVTDNPCVHVAGCRFSYLSNKST